MEPAKAAPIPERNQNVTLTLPEERRKRGMVDPDVESFHHVIDAAHTAMLVFEEDGARVCERWLRQRGLNRDAQLGALFQALANAIPVTKKKGAFIRPEISLLDRMNDALDLGIAFPAEPEPDFDALQRKLFKSKEEDKNNEEPENDEAEDEA